MSDTPLPPATPSAAAALPPSPPPSAPGSASAAAATAAPAVAGPVVHMSAAARWTVAGAVLLALLTGASVAYTWSAQQRLKTLEAELVKRQQDTGGVAAEARETARAAQEQVRDAAAKLALLEARVAETSLQRTQIEDLLQSLARSRDENVLADVDSAIRVAMQQAAITGSAEPLITTLKQADERLARFNQPRLERVRRAIAQDLDRTRAAGVADISVLTIRLDEAIRLVDEIPLLSQAERRPAAPAAGGAAAKPVEPGASAAGAAGGGWFARWREIGADAWQEVRSLVRVTRIDSPEAMLVAPEQAWFLRENLKLRLLNARLALLSRQFDTAQADLRDALSVLERYFDKGARRTATTIELVRQIQTQARQVGVPRPDATLAAIATASAGR